MRMVDHSGLEMLGQDECLRLLASREVGRLGLVQGGQPIILPLNYVVADQGIVLRTAPGTKLRHGNGSRACLEVDDIDPGARSGWSVLAVGRLEEITIFDHPEVQRMQALALSPWAGGDRSHWMRLVVDRLTGRRVGGEAAAGDEGEAAAG